MGIEREVLEFIIVPPFNERASIYNDREKLSGFLRTKFPGYAFTVVAVAPVDDEDEFNVIPVMSFLDDEGRMRMCVYPSLLLMGAIARECETFMDAQRKHPNVQSPIRLVSARVQ